jgi:hypothetical protein
MARHNPRNPFSGRKVSSLGPGPLEVVDQLGRVLQVGDMVLHLRDLKAVTAVITDIQPIVDPTAPKNLMTVQLQASFPVTVERGSILNGTFLTMLAEETGWGEAQKAQEKQEDVESSDGPKRIIP